MAVLRIGTCSWNYPEWAGLVYSSARSADYLAEYSRQFDTVEIDRWFWSLHGPGKLTLPGKKDVTAYAKAVPAGFRFSVKAPNALTLTHYPRKDKTGPPLSNPYFLSPELFREFLERLEPMRGLLGPVMLQFGYLNREQMPSRQHFLDRLDAFLAQCPPGFVTGVELRNPPYLEPPFFQCLTQHRAIPVFLEGYYLPPVSTVVPKTGGCHFPVAVIRLHGPDRPGMDSRSGKKWDRLLEPRDELLAGMAGLVRRLLERGTDVYLNINNHFEGCAPLTIERFRDLLNSR